jgi:sugar phosphate isomerase/epimerase
MLACADFSFPLLNFDQALDLIAALGFEGVDIGLFAGSSHIDPAEALVDVPASARRLRERMAKRDLCVADMFLTPGSDLLELAANHPDSGERRRSREIYLRALDFAARAGARHLTALPGVVFPGENRQTSLARCSEELAWRVEQADRAAIPFGIEPHIGSIAATPAQASALVEMTPGLTLTLDYGHFISEGVPHEQVDALIPHASHFHARCACKDKLQASFEQNAIDFARVLELMAESGYQGALGVEYVWIDWRGCNEVDNLSETILLRSHLEQLGDALADPGPERARGR